VTAVSEPLSDAVGYGIASARPTARIAGRLYYATDTQALSRDNGTSWDSIPLGGSLTVREVDTSPTDSAVTTIEFPNGTLTIVGHVATYAPGGGIGGSVDYDVSPHPTANDIEFKSSGDTAGLTVLGSLDTSVANTDLRSNYHIKKTTTGAFSINGVYKAIPSMPFTVTLDLTDIQWDANYQKAGIMLLEAAPGKLMCFGPAHQLGTLFDMSFSNYTNRTTRNAATDYGTGVRWHRYTRLIVTSSTSVTLQSSPDGHIWTSHATINPGFTIGNVGIFVTGEDNSVTVEAYVDWLRFGTDVIQPAALLWQNVGGSTGDVVKTYSGAGNVYVPGLRGHPDLLPASPSAYDDEFETLAGWTTLGSLDIDNVTDFPSHLHIGNTSIGYAVNGLYKAIPSMPFTMTCKISDGYLLSNYVSLGLILVETGPGKLHTFGPLYGGYGAYPNDLIYAGWGSRTSRSSAADTQLSVIPIWTGPLYLRYVVTSSSSVAVYYSYNGYLWYTHATGINPGFTIAYAGLHVAGHTGGGKVEGVFDWIRFS
jgi:hypothetical protein